MKLFRRAYGLQIWLALDQNAMPHIIFKNIQKTSKDHRWIASFFVNLDCRYCVFKSLGIILPLGRGTLRCHQSRDSETTWISQLREPCNEKIILLKLIKKSFGKNSWKVLWKCYGRLALESQWSELFTCVLLKWWTVECGDCEIKFKFSMLLKCHSV